MIHKIVYKIGRQLRNPSIKKWFLFLKTAESKSLEELKAYQLNKLQEIVNIAYSNSSYYKKKFDTHNIKPSSIKSLTDINKLPILEKTELLENSASIHTNLRFKKVFVANTSGTSGASLEFKRDESADSFNRAAALRGYTWYNVKPWERNGYFWGYNFSKFETVKTKLFDYFQNRFRIFNFNKNQLKSFSKKLNTAKYLHGYSSMIYEIAKMINSAKIEKPKNLKMIKGTSEKIYDSYQKEVKEAFGLKMINEYGATESGIIAFECPFGNMHITMEGVLVEEVDNEIIITNLQMQSFPIIRYKLGDYVKFAPENKKCSCRLAHTIIEEVRGRVGERVYGIEAIYPSLYFYYIFKNLASKHSLFLTYQVVQNKKGMLQFNIEQRLNSKQLELLKDEIRRYFKNDVNFEINHTLNLNSVSKKINSFISTIKK